MELIQPAQWNQQILQVPVLRAQGPVILQGVIHGVMPAAGMPLLALVVVLKKMNAIPRWSMSQRETPP
ncbi:hypothetical protein AWI24_07785 [Enterobacter hormaechei subsp. steigerwaltii]|nr:hypothetical protein AWI24_07785 [Enterobacter hormaechei subsp. steigerwaltii]